MSGATHSQIPIKQRLLSDQRRAKIIALAGVTAFSAMLVALVLVLDGGAPPTTATDRPAVQPNEPTITQERAPGVRYDGGPEEGSRGRLITSSNGSLSVPPFPGVRYDGGPEEGSADVSPSHGRVSEGQAFPGLAEQSEGAQADRRRYDGGPEEGAR